MRFFPLLLVILLLAACGDGEVRRRGDPPALMSVRVLPPAADGTVHVSWYFDLAEDWHLYWPGLNDSGFPPSVQLHLPDGWSARPLRWPVPARYVMPGDLLDHVYDQPLVVLEQVLVPPDPVAAMVQNHAEEGIEPHEWTPTPHRHGETLDFGLAIDMFRGTFPPERPGAIELTPTRD